MFIDAYNDISWFDPSDSRWAVLEYSADFHADRAFTFNRVLVGQDTDPWTCEMTVCNNCLGYSKGKVSWYGEADADISPDVGTGLYGGVDANRADHHCFRD